MSARRTAAAGVKEVRQSVHEITYACPVIRSATTGGACNQRLSPEHQMAHEATISSKQSHTCWTMALQALHAYDSDHVDDEEEEEWKRQSFLISNYDVQLQEDVRAIIDRLLEDVSIAVSGDLKAHHSIVPDFRAAINDDEINIDTSSSSSSSSWSLSSDSEIDEHENERPVFKPVRTKGELGLDELPPIQRLDINARVEELSQVGRVVSILDRLVTVVSFKCLPPLDLDSVLFSKDGTALGPIFDVFGPVKEPRYVMRFNSREEIDEIGIVVDMPVYYAPNLPFTAYVFTTHLMAIKGSDASWKHDNEPPDEVKEYSDDEEERRDKALASRIKRKNFS